jgi:hypothetical protein
LWILEQFFLYIHIHIFDIYYIDIFFKISGFKILLNRIENDLDEKNFLKNIEGEFFVCLFFAFY